MKEYELSILFHPDLEMNVDPALDKVKKIIETSGGKITSEDPEGKKRMCYSIGGNDFALYYYFDVELPAAAPAKISNTLGITDEVIRYLIVKADPRRAKYAAVKAAAEAAEAAEGAEVSAETAEAAASETAEAAESAASETADENSAAATEETNDTKETEEKEA